MTPPLISSELVYIPRSWLSVKELLLTAQDQTGVRLHCTVEDTVGKMVLYDNLADLSSVRDAALEYYTYVLGKNVHWRKQGRDWVLEAHIHLEAPVAVNLPALEDLWRKRLEQEDAEAPTLSSGANIEVGAETPPTANLVEAPGNKSAQVVAAISPPWIDEPLPQEDVSRQWVDRALYMMNHWWERATPKERLGMRRLWKNSDAMGRVPLMALVLAGKINFDMGAEVPLASMKARTEHFLMGPDQAESALAPSAGLAESHGASTTPDLATDSAQAEGVASSLAKANTPQGAGWRWPKHIVSFSSQNWWQVLMGRRVKHPIDPPVPKPSAHVLERRDQARRVFEEVSDQLEEKREASQIRRDKE